MVELGEQPARLVDAVLEEGLGVRVQVALDEERPDRFPQQVGGALVPLETERGRERCRLKINVLFRVMD